MLSATSFLAVLVFVAVARGNLPEDTDQFRSGFADHAPSLLSNFSDYGIILNQRDLFPPLFARQRMVCPDPGGPTCSATKCCASGQKCVSSRSTLLDKNLSSCTKRPNVNTFGTVLQWWLLQAHRGVPNGPRSRGLLPDWLRDL